MAGQPPRELGDVPESWPVLATEDLYRTDWVMALRLDEIHPPDDEQSFGRLVLESSPNRVEKSKTSYCEILTDLLGCASRESAASAAPRST